MPPWHAHAAYERPKHMARSVVGLCDRRRDAAAAFRDLERAGLRGNNGSFSATATSQLARGLVRAGIAEADASVSVDGCSSCAGYVAYPLEKHGRICDVASTARSTSIKW